MGGGGGGGGSGSWRNGSPDPSMMVQFLPRVQRICLQVSSLLGWFQNPQTALGIPEI